METHLPYPLSPLQSGMLFQTLLRPAQGLDIVQLVCTLPQDIDLVLLEQAWRQVWQVNEVLHTGFDWLGSEQPTQRIHPGIAFPWRRIDWRDTPDDPHEILDVFLRQDRLEGFALNQPPLMRFTLLQDNEGFSRLIWTYHHILLDGRGIMPILQQVGEAYAALFAGGEIILRPLPAYQDYIAWLGRQDWSAAKAFWKEYLRGLESPGSLGVNRPQPPIPAGQVDYGVYRRVFSREFTGSLNDLAAGYSFTLNTLLQGAWAILLSRYSGEQDIVFGALRTTRHPALGWQGGHDVIGLMLNTLPVRIRIRPEAPVLTVLQDLRAHAMQLRNSLVGHLSLIEIQKAGEVGFSGRLFQSIVGLENSSLNERLRSRHEVLEKWKFESDEHVGYPLSLKVNAGREVELLLEYDRDQFDDLTAGMLLEHLEVVLSGMVKDPSVPVSRLPILTEAERRRILTEWNDTLTAFPKYKGLHEMLEEWAEKSPDALALVFEGRQLSYRELNVQSDRLARRLQTHGAEPGSWVAISMDRTPEMIVAVLGIFKIGGAYVPIDPALPMERKNLILSETRPVVILSDQENANSLPASGVELILLDTGWLEMESEEEQEQELNPGVDAEPLAYIIYTSGSTGRPKGVLVPQSGLVNLCQAQKKIFEVLPGDRVLLFSSLNFDASISEIAMTLSAGATLVLGRRESIFPGPDLLAFMQQNAITHITLTPSSLANLPEGELPALRSLIVAGEPCPPELITRWGTGRAVFNAYGPTEATVCATIARCIPDGSPPPVGFPIPNVQVYILDPQLEPVPAGASGELVIGGAGVARGYLNHDELTARQFVPDPFSCVEGARLYRTGDLARFKPNGEIELLGRSDGQVKIRGFRIELGEIENAIKMYRNIQDAVVTVREDHPGDKRLTAYVIPDPGSGADVNNLRDFLKNKLPNYMLPAAFVFLENLPLTINGKLDRKSLPAPAAGTGRLATQKPGNALEMRLLEIWDQILGLKVSGIDDDFFEHGGNSLLAVRLMSVIQRELGVKVPVADLFQGPTIRQLAQGIREAKNSSWTPLIKVRPVGTGTPLFILHSPAAAMNLANGLRGNWPVYGIEASGLEEGTEQDASIEQMAGRYLKVLKTVQPQGPYRLMGYCTGGVVAYEMAQQLKGQGESVSLLIQLESFALRGQVHSWRHWFKSVIASLPFWVRRYTGMGWSKSLQQLGRMLRKIRLVGREPEADRNALAAEFERINAGVISDEYEERLRQHVDELGKAQGNYHPQPYPGGLIVFSAKWRFPYQIITSRSDPTLGWGTLAQGGVDVYSFEGEHDNFYRPPHVSAMAGVLRNILLSLDEEEKEKLK